MAEINHTELFGGAMTAQLPSLKVDVSDLRQIPDNQEVFAHPSTDQSIIVEIMEYQTAEDDIQAIRTYFEDLAETQSATFEASSYQFHPIDKSQLSATSCHSCQLMKGVQSVCKFKDNAANLVQISMALLRLPQFQTDILISFNNPIAISVHSTSHPAEPSTSQEAWTQLDFESLVKSLTIVDEGLFG